MPGRDLFVLGALTYFETGKYRIVLCDSFDLSLTLVKPFAATRYVSYAFCNMA